MTCVGGLIEPVVAPEILVDGIGAIETIGNMVCFVLYRRRIVYDGSEGGSVSLEVAARIMATQEAVAAMTAETAHHLAVTRRREPLPSH